MRSAALVLAGACAAQPAVIPPHDNPCVRDGRACVELYVVAHEDDDLLFMNPDISNSIAAGNRVVVVHLTSGDLPPADVEAAFHDQRDPPDFTGYWIDRERGILNAFTAMVRGTEAAFPSYAPAGVVPDGWSATLLDVAGVRLTEYDLGATTAVFVRLSDFQLQTAWNDLPGGGGQHGGVSLPAGNTITDGCDDPIVCPLGSAVPTQQLTRDQLVDVIAGLITRFGADAVSAQDATTPTRGPDPAGMYWDRIAGPDQTGYTDYWDHVFGAAFTMAAASHAQAALAHALAVRLYRGYTISREPVNVSDTEAIAKARTFAAYAVFDAGIVKHYDELDLQRHQTGGAYDLDNSRSWQRREYPITTLDGPVAGRLAVAGRCVDGTPALVECDGAPLWSLTTLGQLQLGDRCLAVGAGGAVVAAPCAPRSAASTLFLFENGQLRSPGAQCITAADALASAECDHEPLAPHATGRVPESQAFALRAPE